MVRIFIQNTAAVLIITAVLISCGAHKFIRENQRHRQIDNSSMRFTFIKDSVKCNDTIKIHVHWENISDDTIILSRSSTFYLSQDVPVDSPFFEPVLLIKDEVLKHDVKIPPKDSFEAEVHFPIDLYVYDTQTLLVFKLQHINNKTFISNSENLIILAE